MSQKKSRKSAKAAKSSKKTIRASKPSRTKVLGKKIAIAPDASVQDLGEALWNEGKFRKPVKSAKTSKKDPDQDMHDDLPAKPVIGTIPTRSENQNSLVEILDYIVGDDDHFEVMQKMFADPENLSLSVKEMLTCALEARIEAYQNVEDEGDRDRGSADADEVLDDDVRYGEQLIGLLADIG